MNIFNHTGHKSLWDWLSKYPDKEKHEWPGWIENGGDVSEVYADCFACEFNTEGDCADVCPLIWPSLKKGSAKDCLGDLFGQYAFEPDLKTKSKLAEKIRDLKVRKGVETIRLKGAGNI